MTDQDDNIAFKLFDTYFAGLPSATTPLGTAPMLVLQGTTKQVAANIVGPPVRTILTANQNRFVSTTGSDSNDGLTLGTAWATLQHAINYIAEKIDVTGFVITINIGVGTFAGVGMASTVGGGIIFWLGAGSASTFIDVGPNDGVLNFGEAFTIAVECSSITYINGLAVKPSSHPASNTIAAAIYLGGQFMNWSPLTAAGANDYKFDVTNSGGGGSLFTLSAQSLIALNFLFASSPSTTLTCGGVTGFTLFNISDGGVIYNAVNWTLSGTLAVNPAVFISNLSTFSNNNGATITGGTVTGPRVQLIACGSAAQGDGTQLGPTFFPGNSFGTVDPSSSYDGFFGAVSGSGLPTTTQFPDPSTGGLYKDTSGGGVYIVYNDAGTIKKVALI